MPLFEYRCAGCGEAFEELVRDADEPVSCPACGREGADRRLPLVRRTSAGGSPGEPARSSGCAGCAGGSCSSCGH